MAQLVDSDIPNVGVHGLSQLTFYHLINRAFLLVNK